MGELCKKSRLLTGYLEMLLEQSIEEHHQSRKDKLSDKTSNLQGKGSGQLG